MKKGKALAERQHIDPDYRVQFAYTVPVEAIVEPKEGKVERAVVIDEKTSLDSKVGARQGGFLHPMPSAVTRHAIETAETAGWPIWEYGF